MAEFDLGIPGLSDFKEIGSGSFATVYSAFEADAGRRVAVKLLVSVDERGRRRFDRERRTMGQTTGHDNIVTMFRSGYTDPGNRPYLVMEHMSGGSLQDLLDTEGPLPIVQAVELIVPVARGLGFAHTTGIVHKDIKPANILISATGVAKLSDFGIAAVRDATGTSQVAFSLAYTAPETFDSTRGPDGAVIDPRDERSDLYSLAVTLYALLTGSAPFSASSQAALIHQIVIEPPQPTTDPALDAFFTVALAKNPNDRYSTATHFIHALTAATSPTPTQPVEPSSRQHTTIVAPPTPPKQSPHTPSRQTPVPRNTAASPEHTTRAQPDPHQSGRAETPLTGGLPPSSGSLRGPGKVRPRWTSWPVLVAVTTVVAVVLGVVIFNIERPNTIVTYTGHTGPTSDVQAVVELANGHLASASSDNTVQIWDPADPEDTIATYTGHTTSVYAVAELANGHIASASVDRTVQIWDPANPEGTIATYTGHTDWVLAVVQLDNGTIASASNDGTVQIWDPDSSEVTVATYDGHTPAVVAVAELANGHIASGSDDRTVQIWDPDNPEVTIATYTGHTSSVQSVVELANGHIASASGDRTVQIWDPDNPEVTIATYTGHTSSVLAVVKLANGHIASASRDTTVQIWDPANP